METKEKVIHFQTSYQSKYRMIYCGRRNVSSLVRVTYDKNKVTCLKCRKYLGLE